jgi:NADPH:quinone reductase
MASSSSSSSSPSLAIHLSTSKKYQAIVVEEFGDESVLKLKTVAEKETLADDEVEVEVRAVGCNPVDGYIRSGTYARKPELPYTPGADGAGVVRRVGSQVTRFARGDRVFMAGNRSGSYAERSLAAESQLHELPSNVSFEQGAAVNVPYATAYRALFLRGNAVAGETVLVHGASGGVGIATVQLAVAAGLRVLGTGGSADGRKLVLDQGADAVFDHTADSYQEQILEATGGRGVDIIVEMLANRNLGADMELLAVGSGRIMIVGNRGEITINLRALMGKGGDIRGIALAHNTDEDRRRSYAAIVAGLRNGSLSPIVGSRLPLAEAPQAHHDLMNTRRYGKLVLFIDDVKSSVLTVDP